MHLDIRFTTRPLARIDFRKGKGGIEFVTRVGGTKPSLFLVLIGGFEDMGNVGFNLHFSKGIDSYPQ